MAALSLLAHFAKQYQVLSELVKNETQKEQEIQILSGFYSNRQNVDAFYARYVSPHRQRVALCGINPGRLGAGISGVPFVDASFLSELLGKNLGDNSERSAQFFRQVVMLFGANRFYASVYVTNFSAFGFQKGKKNLNYYDLSGGVQKAIGEWFATELEMTGVSEIVPCSRAVHDTLNDLHKRGRIKVRVHEPLPHPNWCAFPSHQEEALGKYRDTLDPFLLH